MMKITKPTLWPRPCWILGYPRTGSSLACEILNRSGMFEPQFFEWFNHSKGKSLVATPWSAYNSSGQLFRRLPPYLKIHRSQFDVFFRDDDRGPIESSLPGLCYVLLRRRDLVAATVSYYIATETRTYRLGNPSEAERHRSVKIPVSVERVADSYRHIVWYDRSWDRFLAGRGHLSLYYEDLVADMEGVADRLFAHVGVTGVNVPKILGHVTSIPTGHPQEAEIRAVVQQIKDTV